MFRVPGSASVFTLLFPILLSAQVSFDPQQGPQLTPPASNTQPEQRCVVQGRVTNALTGEPLKKATVNLARRGTGGPDSGSAYQGYAATSDADGSFRFESIEPGDYSLSGHRSGFLRSSYGAKGPMQEGARLTLSPGQQLTNIDLALTPQGVITGRVVDDDGDPVDEATIQALVRRWTRGKTRYLPHGFSRTNDLGEFRIANLQPGRYFLVAQKNRMGHNDAPASPDKPDIRPVRTFYPDALSRELAAPIEIKAGQNLSGMDIHLRTVQTHHVRGHLSGILPEGNPEDLMLNLSPQDEDMPIWGGRSNINKDRSFDLAGVAPGSYTLSLNVAIGVFRSFARQTIEVGSTDLNDVVLNVLPARSVRGRVQIEGTPPAGASPVNWSRVRVFLTLADQGPYFMGSDDSVKADGTFVMESVSPGKYNVQVNNGPDGAYLKSVRFGQQEMLGKELDLSQGAAGELDVVFRYGAAEVDGVAQPAQAAGGSSDSSAPAPASPPAASIVLIPETLRSDGSGMYFGNTNQNGAFSIKDVPPGNYRAYAFEHINMGQLENPDVLKQLESKGTDIEVKENDKKQIQLSIISADDVQQIFTRLGIESE